MKHRGRTRTVIVGVLLAGLGAAGGLYARDAMRTSSAQMALLDHATTTTVAPTTTAAPTTTTTVAPTTTTLPPPMADGQLVLGEHGPEVSALQAKLGELGFWLGNADGTFGQLTRQAVMAFQKAQGLGRDGKAGPATLGALAAGARPTPHDPAGSHLEIDLERQILLVVQDGATRWTINTSTGTGEAYDAPGGGTAVATTPRGSFVIQREVDGYRDAPLGRLYRPKYFSGGIAIHGAGQIPSHPASHGCARVTNAAMDLLWSSGVAVRGTPVLVY